MRIRATLVLLAATAVSYAQIAPAPGMPQEAQAQQAFAFAQAQSMMMTNLAQFHSMIASQAMMLNSVQARSMFLAQAASLQTRVAANEGSMLAAQAMQRSVTLQRQLQIQSAILSMRSRGVENAATMQQVVQIASLDPAKSLRRSAMLHTVAAQASGDSTASQTAAKTASTDVTTLPVEPPPMMIRPTFGNKLGVEKPTFSIKSGTVPAGTKVYLKSETHYATLYYTTNGWTPTTQSAKYTGPITINANTHLEVIAIGPNFQRSALEHADYKVANSPAPVLETTVVVPEDGTLRAGTPVRVAFAGKEIDSASASVGDEITVVLDEDVKLGGSVLAPKGAQVKAALTIADPGDGNGPGDLVFEIHSVDVAGKRVPLFGGETLEGAKGGKDAKITPGMTALAFVAADVALK